MDIVIKDQISLKRLDTYSSYADKRPDKILKWRLEHDLSVSYITGIDRISNRFADNCLSILSKYDQDEDRRLIFECVNLMVTKARTEQGYRSIEY